MRGARCWLWVSLIALLTSQVGAQVAGWQYRHAAALGPRLDLRLPLLSPPRFLPLYPPFLLYRVTLGLWQQAGIHAFDTRLRLAWTAWGLAVLAGILGARLLATAPVRVTTHWATRRALRRMRLLGPPGVVLGRWGRQLVCDDASTHVLVIGPTRAGKGEGVVLPTLLSWPHSVLVYDPKGELAAQTAAYRRTCSTVITCDPTAATTQGCDLLAPLVVNGPTEQRDCARLLDRLTDPEGTAAGRENETSKHFREMANLLGQGLVLSSLRVGLCTLPAIAYRLHSTPAADLVAQMAPQAHILIQSAVQTLEALDRPHLHGILATLKRAFAPFLAEAVGRLVSRQDFSLATLRTGATPLTIYYTVPFGHQAALRAVTRLWFQTLFDAATASLTAWDHRLLVLLDEVTTLGSFPLLTDGFDFAAGYGIKLLLITQSLHRLTAVHGPSHNFFEGAQTRLLFAPNTHEMAARLAPEAGEHVRVKHRVSRQGFPLGRRHRSVSTEEVPELLLSATALAQLSRRQVLLLPGTGPPAVLTAIRAWKERPWRQRRTPIADRSV